jgi:tRNA/rRNA methyltransferase
MDVSEQYRNWPAIILVNPQLGENIGSVARAMWNCGLKNLRLVAPRDSWPNERAVASASGADIVLEQAQLFPDVSSAVADLHHIYATTARRRDMTKAVIPPRDAAVELREHVDSGHLTGILFGAERAGLNNEDVILAEKIIEIPCNPEFSSFNLSQAVLIVAHEYFLSHVGTSNRAQAAPESELATADQVEGLLEHLDRELDEAEYYREANLRPTMQRNLHSVFRRAQLTDQEVRSFRGVVARLAKWRGRREV